MAWETRNGFGRYYTRSKRLNGKVVREYVGKGEIGEIEAGKDFEVRQKKRIDKKSAVQEFLKIAEANNDLERLHQLTNLIVKISFIQAGFYQHNRGEWRRPKRCKKSR